MSTQEDRIAYLEAVVQKLIERVEKLEVSDTRQTPTDVYFPKVQITQEQLEKINSLPNATRNIVVKYLKRLSAPYDTRTANYCISDVDIEDAIEHANNEMRERVQQNS